MVAQKLKYHIWERGLELDDLRQIGEIAYIKTIQKLNENRVLNIKAYLWKAVYRQLKIDIEKNDSFICCENIYEMMSNVYDRSAASDINKDKLVLIMQEILSKLDEKKRFVIESLYGFNNKIISQAQIGRTLEMSYQGVASKRDVVFREIRRDKELMYKLEEFIN